MKKLIILDRDGVINYDSKDYIKCPAEWQPLPGSLPAISRLNTLGYTVAIATNQSGLARKYYDVDTLDAIHNKMFAAALDNNAVIDKVFYCPHGPSDGCGCRKPKPGLLYQIQDHYQIDLKNCYFVGDSLRDIEAAIAVEATPVLVKTGNGEATFNKNADFFRDKLCSADLAGFAEYLSNELQPRPPILCSNKP